MVETAQQMWNEVAVPRTATTVYEALHRRRMAWKFDDREIPRDAMDRMLATSVWAPNHKQTEPWRFFVSTKESAHRQKVADFVHATVLARNSEDTTRAQRQQEWVLEQPLIIFAYSVPGTTDEMTQENYASVCCALHNVGLAGVAEGLSVTWETGGVAKTPGLAEAVGGEAEWQMVAVATVGFPDEESPSSRTPAEEYVIWPE